MKYIIVKSTSLHQLHEEVNKYLEQGYRCQGGIAIASDAKAVLVLQAMIKEG